MCGTQKRECFDIVERLLRCKRSIKSLSYSPIEKNPASQLLCSSLSTWFYKELSQQLLFIIIDLMVILKMLFIILKEAASASSGESQKEIDKLKSENTKLRAESAKYREEAAATQKKYEKREDDRFERIRDLFSRVLTVCIGSVSIHVHVFSLSHILAYLRAASRNLHNCFSFKQSYTV